MTGNGYAIWIGPNRRTREYDAVATLIDSIAAQHSTQRFEPHITLLSGIRHEERLVGEYVEQLAQQLDPFAVTLEEAGSEPEYFKALFLHVAKTTELLHANRIAQEICHRQKPNYAPRASLAYGSFSPDDIGRIRNQYSTEILEMQSAFQIDRLELWNTTGPVHVWTHLSTHFLKGRSP
jgi:2'-5' RNA ligase